MRCKRLREPDRYAPPPTSRVQRKWAPIIAAFLEGRMDDLYSIQRTGARGRIFSCLVADALKLVGLSFRPEPIFQHRDPNSWYMDFATKNGLKLWTYSFYNPDFVLSDGTWAEATLSENSAYKKVFRYGHQSSRLLVIWLDKDNGLHKDLCASTTFPNAQVLEIISFYPDLMQCAGGEDLVRKFEQLKTLRGRLL